VLVVLDADCLIAGTLATRGAASRLLDSWQDGAFELVTCPRRITEVRRALLDPRIAGRYEIPAEEVDAFCVRLKEESVFKSDPVDPPRVVSGDANDDYLVALALDSGADALVTRDRHFDALVVPGLRILFPGVLVHELGD